MVFVLPSKDLQIRVGQHVSVDGKVYHPYLSDWSSMWDRASVADFLEYLQQAFAKEPPVISNGSQQQRQQQDHKQAVGQASYWQGQSTAPAVPPKQHTDRQEGVDKAPPRPPKPGESPPVVTPARDTARDGPPLPPLPGESSMRQSVRPVSMTLPYGLQQEHMQRTASQNLGQHHQMPVRWSQQQGVHKSSIGSPVYATQPPVQSNGPQQMLRQPSARQTQGYQSPHPYANMQQTRATQPHTQQTAPVRARQKQPTPDLLSDPFDVALPATITVQAPPIPPNPEKEHLLQALAATCGQQAQQKVRQNYSAIAPLQAQNYALKAAHTRLEAELAQLQALDVALASNEAILRRSIQDCDHAIANAQTMKQPPIDDVLIAPTLVAQQLWTACAEEAACREAMYALQNAVDKGRISGVDFVRQMRGLGRECFLKMALARKCARGLGLNDRR